MVNKQYVDGLRLKPGAPLKLDLLPQGDGEVCFYLGHNEHALQGCYGVRNGRFLETGPYPLESITRISVQVDAEEQESAIASIREGIRECTSEMECIEHELSGRYD